MSGIAHSAVQPSETSGEMSHGRQVYHACMTAFMCLMFLALALLAGRFLVPIHDFPASSVLVAAAILFEIFVAGGIYLQIRNYCRIIRQFSYDGRSLKYGTLGSSQEQLRDVKQIIDVRQGRMGAPSIGFSVVFSDNKKVYLDYSMPHAREAAERLRLDLA